MIRTSMTPLKGMLLTLGCTTMIACGGGSGGGGGGDAIKGTAAIGAPISAATVSVQCGTVSLTTMTDSAGNYSISKKILDDESAVLPCALKVSSTMGDLFSYASKSGVTNISPLTTLALSRAVNNTTGGSLSTWFSTLDADTDHAALKTKLDEATADLEDALKDSTGESRVPFDVFSSSFKADGKSDYDVWLDSFNDALSTYAGGFAGFTSWYSSVGVATNFGTLVITLEPGTGGPGGDYDLHLTVSVAGHGNTTIVENVPKPASKAEFCGADSYAGYMGVAGITIKSCTFSGNKGTMKATVSSAGYTVSYNATYEWK